MTNVIVPIRFGTVVEGPLSLQTRNFYTSLLTLCGLESSDAVDVCTLPLAMSYEHSISPDGVADAIVGITAKHAGDTLLIDVGGPAERDVCRPNFIRGVANAIYLLAESKTFSTFILFFSISISERDVASKFLFPIAQAHNVKIVFGDGSARGVADDRLHALQDRVPKLVEQATANVADRFRQKLIRHVGYFRIEHTGAIVPHFFDGVECHDEIYQILYMRMVTENFSKYTSLLFDDRVSKWFTDPFIAAANAAGLGTKTKPFDPDLHAAGLLEDNACVYTPIVRTGRSIGRMCSQVRGLSAGNDKLFFSLLSTQGGREVNGHRQLKVTALSETAMNVSISYDLRVPDVGDNIQRLWRNYDSQDHAEVPSENWKLSSCATWGMILEAGIIEEMDRPKTRDDAGYVPASAALAELNGPFIAQKISSILSGHYGVTSGLNLVFICPKEEQALRIAECLRVLMGYSFIPVPREIIDFAVERGDQLDSDQLSDRFKDDPRFSEAIEQLFRIGQVEPPGITIEPPDVVVFDEFSFSGKTINGLSRIAPAVNLEILCTICLLDLGGERREDPHFYALYDLDYSSWAVRE